MDKATVITLIICTTLVLICLINRSKGERK